MAQASPKISVQYIQDVTVAIIADEKILEEDQIAAIENAVMPLIDQSPGLSLVLDFEKVQFLSSAVLGLLIRINKKVLESDGKLSLCCIDPKILEVFKITRLDNVFTICQTRDDAVEELM